MYPDLNKSSRPYVRSSSFKMALLFTILCGTAVVVLGYFTYSFDKHHFLADLAPVLAADAEYFETLDQSGDLRQAIELYKGTEGKIAILKNESGHTLAGSDFDFSEDLNDHQLSGLASTSNDKLYLIQKHILSDGRQLLVGIDVTALSDDLDFIRRLSLLSIGAIIIVIIFSYIISVFVVTRTNRVARIAKEIIDTGDLSRRVPVDSRWDDLSYMVGFLNQTMDRIEGLMQGIKDVSDNIAHDLRTPLTRLRNNLEDLKKNPKISRDKALKLQTEKLTAEADHLLSTFNALLRISRLETEKQRSQFRTVDLSAIVADVFELYEPLAEAKDLTMDFEREPVTIFGDRDLLFQAFVNLLDNAVKYTPQSGHILLQLGQEDGRPFFLIYNSGPGMHVSDPERMFERFYRGEKSRSTAGSGLGLSLVAAIVGVHDAAVQAVSGDEGLEVKIIFPAD